MNAGKVVGGILGGLFGEIFEVCKGEVCQSLAYLGGCNSGLPPLAV